MNAPGFVRAAWTIARRDITATIFSRGFLIWLAMPILGLLFGILASVAQGGGGDSSREPTSAAVIDTEGAFAPWLIETARLERARDRYAQLRRRFSTVRPTEALPEALSPPPARLDVEQLQTLAENDRLDRIEREFQLGTGDTLKALGLEPTRMALTRVTAEGDLDRQAQRLLSGDPGRFGAVVLVREGEVSVVRRDGTNVDRLRTLAGQAWERRALDQAGLLQPLKTAMAGRPDIGVETIADDDREAPAGQRPDDRSTALATGAAIVLFTLISLLAGALLSNMVEEKGNKVIEILVASVPIPAIFAGKLVGMLAVSLLGVGVWGAVFGGGAMFILGQLPAGILADPARGWPQFVTLVSAYFVTAYLIYGAVYLGIGSLCTSIREVQTLSMPITILQMVVLVWTIGAIGDPDGLSATIASWFPLSAPYMWAARAAAGEQLGMHMLAIAYQLAFAGLIIFVAARLFRYGVLRSGPPPSLKQLGSSARFWVRGRSA
jgi:ABC-2 type transport system permease protein|tara:strand:- start:16399 stop:17880 length:1482 start_codon:yes stop_codon:yes gene_type:complete